MVKVRQDTPSLHIPGYKESQSVGSIIRLEGDSNYTRLYLVNRQEPLFCARTLKHFEGQLTNFIRVHKSVLLNPDYVREVQQLSSKQLNLVLIDGSIQEASRRRIIEINARLFNDQPVAHKRIWMLGQKNGY